MFYRHLPLFTLLVLLVGLVSAAPADSRQLQRRNIIPDIAKSKAELPTKSEMTHALKTGPGQATFWSGRTNGVSTIEAAEAHAHKTGGKTMEMALKDGNIKMPKWEPGSKHKKEWKEVSTLFAKHAQGDVHAFVGQEVRPNRVYAYKEKPLLIKNPKVTSITEHYHDGTTAVVHQKPPKSKSKREYLRRMLSDDSLLDYQ